jgi:hypothetical protein
MSIVYRVLWRPINLGTRILLWHHSVQCWVEHSTYEFNELCLKVKYIGVCTLLRVKESSLMSIVYWVLWRPTNLGTRILLRPHPLQCRVEHSKHQFTNELRLKVKIFMLVASQRQISQLQKGWQLQQIHKFCSLHI